MFGPRLLRCSFCGRDETQVAKLVAGPKVYICDECVATARRIMESGRDGESSEPIATLTPWRRFLARVRKLVAGGGNVQRTLVTHEPETRHEY